MQTGLAAAARWRKRHGKRAIRTLRVIQLRRYGLTDADYVELLANQGVFAPSVAPTTLGAATAVSVGTSRSITTILTGRVRGLLCDRCNRVLGCMDDSPELLRKAAVY